MSKSVIVIKDGKKFKVLVCFIQRGIEFSNPENANKEAQEIADYEHIDNVKLYEEKEKDA